MTQPLCYCCGKPIAKQTTSVWLKLKGNNSTDNSWPFSRVLRVDEFPRNKAECQALTNYPVMSVKRAADVSYICQFTEWDGKSYVDPYFCTGDCAKRMGYIMAKEGRCTRAHNEATRAQKQKEIA